MVRSGGCLIFVPSLFPSLLPSVVLPETAEADYAEFQATPTHIHEEAPRGVLRGGGAGSGGGGGMCMTCEIRCRANITLIAPRVSLFAAR